MPHPGQVVVFAFPETGQGQGKLRPALLIAPTPGTYDDWLACMISSQLRHEINGFDEIVRPGDADYEASGLKVASLIRISRLAVIASSTLEGAIGSIAEERLSRIRKNLATWVGE
jgi:mRNA interferase MazF